MTKDELTDYIVDKETQYTDEIIDEALEMFRMDAQSGRCELENAFTSMYYRYVMQTHNFTQSHFHEINQLYIEALLEKDASDPRDLAYLYLKNVEYYTSMNAPAECARYINLVLEIEGLPDRYYYSGLANMVGLMRNPSLKEDGIVYIEKFKEFSELESASSRHRSMVFITLIDAYICLGMKEAYEEIRENCIRQMKCEESAYLRATCRLRLFAADISLLGHKVDEYEAGVFRETIQSPEKEVLVSDTPGKSLVIVLEAFSPFLSKREVVDAVKKCMPMVTMDVDRILLYEFLFERIGIDKREYEEIYDEYFELLRNYHKYLENFRAQEVHNEIAFYKRNSKYKKYAFMDSLTKLYNRHAFQVEVEKLKNKEELRDDLVIIMGDMNGLKRINDFYGHKFGDDMIVAVATIFRDVIERHGLAFRVGGDEFFGIIHTKEPQKVIDEIKSKLTENLDPSGKPLLMALGYVEANEFTEETIEGLLSIADTRMYEDKRNRE